MAAPEYDAIIDGLRDGDAASERIVRAWVRDCVNYVCRGSRVSREELEDLCSECFKVFYTSVSNGTYRGDGPKSFIGIVCKRKFNDLLRDRYDHPDGSGQDVTEIPDTTPTAEEKALRVIRGARLMKALPLLSRKDRLILLLRGLEQSFKEIGEHLGLSEGAARVEHWKAIRRLRKLIEDNKP